MLDLRDCAFEELSRLHSRVCPRQVLGVRIGRYAGELLGLSVPRADKRLSAITEIDGCFADAVSVATGCWLGRRTLRVVYYGKAAATFVDLQTRKAVRIWPAAGARSAAQHFAPCAPDRWHAQLEAYRVMPTAELLNWCHVTVNAELAELFNADSTRSACAGCGEEILQQRNVLRESLAVCGACSGEAYYTQVGEPLLKRDANTALHEERRNG